MASAGHLLRRFLGAIRPGSPRRGDETWAVAGLNGAEQTLWFRMSNPDRRHAVGVARAVAAELGSEATQPVLAAALLHDVGKVVSGFRTPARVVATLWWAVVPSSKAEPWCNASSTWLRRLGEYHRHPELGEQLLIEAGSDPITSGWAADHHRPAEQWRLDRRIGNVLKACDDD